MPLAAGGVVIIYAQQQIYLLGKCLFRTSAIHPPVSCRRWPLYQQTSFHVAEEHPICVTACTFFLADKLLLTCRRLYRHHGPLTDHSAALRQCQSMSSDCTLVAMPVFAWQAPSSSLLSDAMFYACAEKGAEHGSNRTKSDAQAWQRQGQVCILCSNTAGEPGSDHSPLTMGVLSSAP